MSTDIAPGLCQCGCGRKTNRAKRTYGQRGVRKGEYWRFVPGHYFDEQREAQGRAFWIETDGPLETPCWIWQGAGGRCGDRKHVYPLRQVRGERRPELVHRRSLEERLGRPITPGWHAHHRCEKTMCVNPDHLEELSPGDHKRLHMRASATRAAAEREDVIS